MDALRKTPPQDFDEPESMESDSVELSFDDFTDIIPKDDIDYPFDDAKKLEGILRYSPEPLITGMAPTTVEYDVTLRSGSNLLLIHGLDGEQRLRDVITETARSFDQLSLKRIPYNRKSLWSFVFSGRDQPQIVVRDYESGESVEFEDIVDLSQEELVEEYRLKKARIVFDYQGEEINVRYSDDVLSFADGVSDEGREYVLQLYEKYVVDGQILERFE